MVLDNELPLHMIKHPIGSVGMNVRPCLEVPLSIRGTLIGGAQPLFCVPLASADLTQLEAQAQVTLAMAPDLVEWRADHYRELTPGKVVEAASRLRSVFENRPTIFTLRLKAEGGSRDITHDKRIDCFEAIIDAREVDLVDVELSNGRGFLDRVVGPAHGKGLRVVLSFHDFTSTPASEDLLETIAAMNDQGADIAKIAVMPQQPEDVLRVFQVTLEARRRFPTLALSTMSMGKMGSLSRIAGFLYGSDLAYAVAQEVTAPGQIPLTEARALTRALLSYA